MSVHETIRVLDALAEADDQTAHDVAHRAGLQPGAAHQIITRLEVEAFATSVEAPVPGRPGRRLYRLTNVGREAARKETEETT